MEMEYIDIIKEYDDKLFDLFKKEFSSFPEFNRFFENERLCNEWGRRCTVIIRMLKKIIFEETKSKWVKDAINILVNFISDKNTDNKELQFLSSFNNDVFYKYQTNLLFFRNFISGHFFHLISKYKDNNEKNIISDIAMSIKLSLLTPNYEFLKGLFDLLQYSLDKDVNIYIEFILLLNNEDIIKAIIDNKKCKLNKNQISYLKEKEIDLEKVSDLLVELKSIKDTNQDIINYVQKKNKNKRHKKKKNKVTYINDNSKDEVKNSIINDENNIINKEKKKNIENKIELNINEIKEENKKDECNIDKIEINRNEPKEENKKDESNINNINKEKNEFNKLIKVIPNKKDDFSDNKNEKIKINERREEKDEKQNNNKEKNNTINILEKLNQLEKDFNEMKEKNKTLMKDNENLKKEIETLKDEKKSMRNEIEFLKNEIEFLKNEKKSMRNEIEFLKKENKNLKETFLKKEIKYKTIISKMEKEISLLKNKVDSCEMKLNMITYREFIKDLINYCFNYFNCLNKGNNFYTKVIGLKNIISNKNIFLIDRENIILYNFIFIGYITLKNVSKNLHGGSFGKGLSIENFIKCLKQYIDKYDLDILSFMNISKDFDIKRIVFNIEDIKNIFQKINYSYNFKDNYLD